MKAFGTRPTYQIFAVVTLLTGLVYLLFNVTYLSKRPQVEGNDIVKKKPKATVATIQDGADKISKIQEVEASKRHKEAKLECDPYIIDDLEAVNNAKNLDIAECNIIEKVDKDEEEDKEIQRHAQLNPAFEPDHHDEAPQITVEKGASTIK